jgi:hypothetical protein
MFETGDAPSVAATIVGIRRKRAFRLAGQSAMAAVAVTGIGLSAWGASSLFQAQPAAVPTPSLSPTETATPTPTPTSTPTPTPMPTPTPTRVPRAGAVAGDWSSVNPIDYPPTATKQFYGEPTSRVVEDWMWDFVGDGWALDTWRSNAPSVDAQVLFLVAPDGRLFRQATLRTDVEIRIEGFSPDKGLAWLSRRRADGAFQTVQYDLKADTVDEHWLDAALPAFAAGDPTWQNGAVRLSGFGFGKEWWAFTTRANEVVGLFWRDPDTGAVHGDTMADVARQQFGTTTVQVMGQKSLAGRNVVWMIKDPTGGVPGRQYWLQDDDKGTLTQAFPLHPTDATFYGGIDGVADDGSWIILACWYPPNGDRADDFLLSLDGVTPPVITRGDPNKTMWVKPPTTPPGGQYTSGGSGD